MDSAFRVDPHPPASPGSLDLMAGSKKSVKVSLSSECKSISQMAEGLILLPDPGYRGTLSPSAPRPRDQVAG